MGHRSVADAQRYISAREFAEWIAYDRMSPVGLERAEWGAAMLAAVFANAFRSSKQRAFSPADFLPQWDRQRKTPEELEQAIMGSLKLQNVIRKDKEREEPRRGNKDDR